MDVNQLTTPLSFVKEQLSKKGVFLGCGLDCEDCLIQPEGCQCLKDAVQSLIARGILQFDHVVVEPKIGEDEVDMITILVKPKKIHVPVTIPVPAKRSPVTITLPGPVPYVSGKVIPWYGGEL